MVILYLTLVTIIIVILVKFKIKHTQNIGNLTMVTGGVKSGKSTTSVYLAVKKFKSQHIKYHLKKIWCKIRKKKFDNEHPLLYSNVPLKHKYYTKLSKDLILQNTRFKYGSVIYIQEASLLADSMAWKDMDLNNATLLLFKLIAHETKGGYMILDTQSIQDVHYNLKRSLSSYLYVHKTFKWIPFVLFVKVQEMRYDPVNSVNIVEGDMDEQNYKWLIFSKKTWKRFDRYTYSILTDHLKVEGEPTKAETLKSKEIIRFGKELR